MNEQKQNSTPKHRIAMSKGIRKMERIWECKTECSTNTPIESEKENESIWRLVFHANVHAIAKFWSQSALSWHVYVSVAMHAAKSGEKNGDSKPNTQLYLLNYYWRWSGSIDENCGTKWKKIETNLHQMQKKKKSHITLTHTGSYK